MLAGWSGGVLKDDGRDIAPDEICRRGWRMDDFNGNGRRLAGFHGSNTKSGTVGRSGRREGDGDGGEGERAQPRGNVCPPKNRCR